MSTTERAVCWHCGTVRDGLAQPCPGCGAVPSGEGLWVAWLLSTRHLAADDLPKVAARIRAGERPRPTEALLERAREALGQSLRVDPGLTQGQRWACLATSLLLTPLPGLVAAAWWWRLRPVSARQALALSAPAAILTTGAAAYLLIG